MLGADTIIVVVVTLAAKALVVENVEAIADGTVPLGSAMVLLTIDVSVPDDVVVCTVVVRAVYIAKEVSDGLIEVVSLKLGPEEACADVVAMSLGTLLNVTTPVPVASVVVMRPVDAIGGPSDDDVELRIDERVDVAVALDDVTCTVGAACVVEELSDALVEVVNLELGPEEACTEDNVTVEPRVDELVDASALETSGPDACGEAAVTLVVELLNVTAPIAVAVAVVMKASDVISGPSDDDEKL